MYHYNLSEWKVSNKAYEPYRELLGGVINWLKKTNRPKSQVLLLLTHIQPLIEVVTSLGKAGHQALANKNYLVFIGPK